METQDKSVSVVDSSMVNISLIKFPYVIIYNDEIHAFNDSLTIFSFIFF